MKKAHLTLLVLTIVSGLVLICGVSLAEERKDINPTLGECRSIPKFEGLFEGEIPAWKIKRNRKCIEMKKDEKK